MLRTTILFLHDRTKVVLNGELAAESAEFLPRAVAQCCPAGETVEIDLDGITSADRTGDQALISLFQAHRRFLCSSPYAQTLCQRLEIPFEESRP